MRKETARAPSASVMRAPSTSTAATGGAFSTAAISCPKSSRAACRSAIATAYGREQRRAGLLCRAGEAGCRLDERVDDLSGPGVAVAGREQCVDVTPAHVLLDRAYGDAAVVADEKARYPADADSAKDETACGEWLGRGRHDARVESGVAACLDEEAVFGCDDPVVFGELG